MEQPRNLLWRLLPPGVLALAEAPFGSFIDAFVARWLGRDLTTMVGEYVQPISWLCLGAIIAFLLDDILAENSQIKAWWRKFCPFEYALVFGKPGYNEDFRIGAEIFATRTSREVALLLRVAHAEFYLDGTAKWIWHPQETLCDLPIVRKGERRNIEIARRTAAGDDVLTICGKQVGLGGAGSANMYRFEFTVATRRKSYSTYKDFSFLPDKGRFTHPLTPGEITNVDQGGKHSGWLPWS